MSSPPAPAVPGLTRRSLLGGSAAGLALLLAGCTSAPSASRGPAVDRQAAALAAQVPVQEALVSAYRAAGAADAALAARVAPQAGQAQAQLARLKAAAPSASRSGTASSPVAAASTSPSGPPAGQDPAAWLRAQVTATADSHTNTCLDLTGARAALLGSIAAGLRGQAARLS